MSGLCSWLPEYNGLHQENAVLGFLVLKKMKQIIKNILHYLRVKNCQHC